MSIRRHSQGCRKACLLLLLYLPAALAIAQDDRQSTEYLHTVDSKMARFSGDAERYTLHTLDALISQERHMQDKMAASDPVASQRLFGHVIDSLQRLKSAISGASAKAGRLLPANYFPYSDSLRQALAFLRQGAAGKGAAISSRLASSLQQVDVLEGKLNTIAVVQTYIRQQQQALTSVLGRLPEYAGSLQQLNKTAYYYSAQIAAYKASLKAPAHIERQLLDAIGQSPKFQDLMEHNGQLAGLFVPRSAFLHPPLTNNTVNGIPSRVQLQQYLRKYVPTGDTSDPAGELQKKFTAIGHQLHENGAAPGAGGNGLGGAGAGFPGGSGGFSRAAAASADASGALGGLTGGLSGGTSAAAGGGLGGLTGGLSGGTGNTAGSMPPAMGAGGTANAGFTPNSQKTKTFGHRLEWGVDLQFGRAVSYLPATTNFGIKAGYKLNDRLSAGIGVDYLIGMGTGWKDIHFSSQGVGLRSYGKWQIKKGWNIQGGAESNYMSAFTSISQLRGLQQWQTSALLGISKQYRVSRKINGNFQVLYDFLYQQHRPTTQPVLFRLGYDLK